MIDLLVEIIIRLCLFKAFKCHVNMPNVKLLLCRCGMCTFSRLPVVSAEVLSYTSEVSEANYECALSLFLLLTLPLLAI